MLEISVNLVTKITSKSQHEIKCYYTIYSIHVIMFYFFIFFLYLVILNSTFWSNSWLLSGDVSNFA